ncbi:hypothetical protein AB0D45_00055 [Streptomyces sp. NPDC048352]|uniref:hypothetical protein n=1 Tax=Streptomyces sp. NPDC048352 TaxID=3154718 RepID=UPI00342C68A0
MSNITETEYGLASDSWEDIESLGRIPRPRAEAIRADSRRQWPDVYLIQRVSGEPWRRAAS